MQKRVTLKDVARAAGVHVSTVSRALDPNSKTPLSKDVENKIRDVARSLGYRRNQVAAGLRTSRTMSVGVMIPDITNSLFPPFVRGIDSHLEANGYASILVNTDNIPERESRLIDLLRERGVDGIISVAARRDDPEIAQVAEQGLPVVTLNRRLDGSSIPYIINDDSSGIHLSLQHLFDLGHREIGHIAGPKNLSTGQLRAEAFDVGCSRLDLPASKSHVVYSHQYDEAEGKRCAVELLTNYPQVTALLCSNDRLAIGAIAGVKELGRSVPEDISVTGFNNSPSLEHITPQITTIHIHKFEAGRTAAELLLKLINGEVSGPVGTILPVELVERESTKPPKSAN